MDIIKWILSDGYLTMDNIIPFSLLHLKIGYPFSEILYPVLL